PHREEPARAAGLEGAAQAGACEMRQGASMVRSATPPNPAHAGGLLARLSFTQNFLGNHPAITRRLPGTIPGRALSGPYEGPRRPWLMESVSWAGVGLSAVLAGVGVIGLVGFESL